MGKKPLFLLLALLAPGCAHRSAPATTARPEAPPPPAVRPSDPKAIVAFDELEPKLDPPTRTPATAPTSEPSRPPIDAVVLYAEARDSLLLGRRQKAVDLLERAASLDPQSYEVCVALGEAYQNGAWDERSLAALLKAAEIDPDHAKLQADIGRQLLAKGDAAEGVRRLRLALLASDAADDSAAVTTAELHLSKALREAGYTTAAVELLERVLNRVTSPSLDVRTSPELFFYVTHPEYLASQAGQLYEQLGRYDEALRAYEAVADGEPANFENRARVVRTLVAVRRNDDAARAAADAVGRFKASPDSVRLLREVYAAIGREGQAADQLRKVYERRPDDRSILYALSDLLSADGRYDEATRVLERAAGRNPDDFEIVRRLVVLGQEDRPDPAAAASRLVHWSADHPDSIHQMSGLWAQLLRPRPEGRVRPATVEGLDFGANPSARVQAAKLFWAARVAQASDRRSVARDALDRAVAVEGEPFAPAYRAQLDAIWAHNDFSVADKAARSRRLADRAKKLGSESLAQELVALSLLNEDKPIDSLAAFDAAVKLGGKSADLQLGRALAARKAGETTRFEQLLWKLIGEWPQYEDGYEALYAHYVTAGAGPLADKVLAAWQLADSQGVGYRLTRARRYFAAGNPAAGERLLLEVFDDAPDDPTVNALLQSLFKETNRLDDLVSRYRTKLGENPVDLAVLNELVDVESVRGKAADAVSAIDAAREALGDSDADALYQLAHIYMTAGRNDASEAALRDALRADPHHGPAGNDLGYAMSDRGENLAEAERLIRLATSAEPDNSAYLDSLGWVLYKRGRFAEAGAELERALAYSRRPDPVTLDHLGDALYRGGKRSDASARWKSAAEGLATMPPALAQREDLKTLRESLDRKTKQADAGEPVTVAPVVEEQAPTSAATHAKN